MYKLFTKKRVANTLLSSLLLTTLTLGSIASVSAAKIDLSQEIVIKAKRQAGDLKNKIASYLDDVVITQGSLTINADIVQVISNSNNDDKTYVAKGKPAKFEQLLDDGTPINLEADEIKYEPGNNTITIVGNAVLSQAGSEVKGGKIVYNTLTEQLSAEAGDNDEGITQTILKPKEKAKDQQ